MDCGVSCARFLLIVFNIIFWLSGVCILGVGLWLSVDKSLIDLIDFVHIDETDPILKIGAYVLIGVGAFVFVVGFVGCFGALKASKFLLGLYMFFLWVVLTAELGIGIAVFIHKGKIEEDFEEEWADELQEDAYARNLTLEEVKYTSFGASMNLVQWKFDCCGVTGVGDYTRNNSNWPKTDSSGESRPFPFTCCVLDGDVDDPKEVQKSEVKDITKCYNQENDYIWTNGCKEGLLDWFSEHATILGGIGIGIACLEIFGFLFACCLCRAVDKQDY